MLALLCLAATIPPIPKANHRSASIHQGAAAAKLLIKPSIVTPRDTLIVWQYPPSINSSNYWWNIETSTDLKRWSVLVSNASGDASVTVGKSKPLRVYRLSGRLNP